MNEGSGVHGLGYLRDLARGGNRIRQTARIDIHRKWKCSSPSTVLVQAQCVTRDAGSTRCPTESTASEKGADLPSKGIAVLQTRKKKP